MARGRDLERSRERILDAALAEFAARGLFGARTRSIARRARLSEQMIFHCFGSKDALYRRVIERELQRIGGVLQADENLQLATHLVAGFERALDEDRDSLRLWQWEALAPSKRRLASDDARRSLFEAELAQLRIERARGEFPAEFDERDMLMATLGLRLIPALLPQLAPLIFDLSNDDPRFRTRWAEFLGRVSALLGKRA
jgi:TetR/AcrR family transcriptional regulator